jgi:thioredoxin-related protein
MKTSIFITAITLLIATTAAADTGVKFFEGSLITAKEKAMAESKMYFVEFYAKWCKPCQWMDKHTYTDEQLARYVNENYLAVRVDIDDFDGFAWKQKYNVEYLPTILVFNHEGRMLGKYEKSLSANKLLGILKEHQGGYQTPVVTEVVREDPTPTRKVEPEPVYTASAEPETQPARPNVASEQIVIGPEYRVQVGTYSVADNVFRQVEELKTTFNHPVKVFNHKNIDTGTVLYRVTVGKFSAREDAEVLLATLKRKGYDGFVKETSKL